MLPGDKHIIELEAQMDMLLEVLGEIQDIRSHIFRAKRTDRRHVLEGIDRCNRAITKLQEDAGQALSRELAEKDQAAKDDRADMKMEEERGG